MGQKFRHNHSISHCSQDKCIFLFYAEIQDGRQKWRESNFCKKFPVHSAGTLPVKNLVEIALSRTTDPDKFFFAFYLDNLDGRQNWRERDFGGKLPVHSAENLWVKNFVEIALSCTISEILKIFHFQH